MMRKPLIVVLLQIATIAIRLRHSDFLTNRSSNLYRLNHTGQVCYLRAVLNDAFTDRSCDFRIEDSSVVSEWVYARDEQQYTYDQLIIKGEGSEDMVYVWSEDYILVETTPFSIGVPSEIYANKDYMNMVRNLVNEYKLLSKRASYYSI